MKKVIAVIVVAVSLSACSTAPVERTCRKENVAGSAIRTCQTAAAPLTEADLLALAATKPVAIMRRAAN